MVCSIFPFSPIQAAVPVAAPAASPAAAHAPATAAPAPAAVGGHFTRTMTWKNNVLARNPGLTIISALPVREHGDSITRFFRAEYNGAIGVLKVPGRGPWSLGEDHGTLRVHLLITTAARAAHNILTVVHFDHIPLLHAPGETLPGFWSPAYARTAADLKPEERTDDRITRIINAVASALSCMHDHGIIHGDVKTENFFEEPMDATAGLRHVVLGDFGAVVEFGDPIEAFSPGFTVAEWASQPAHAKMDWAGLVLSGLHLLDRLPAAAGVVAGAGAGAGAVSNLRCVRFQDMATAVDGLRGQTTEAARLIVQLFDEHVRQHAPLEQ